MFGIGWLELVVIAVLLLVIVGPKDLPLVLAKLGKVVRHIRAYFYRLNQGLDEFLSDAEAAELKRKQLEEHDTKE